ncbi:MAG: glucose 1-dehydrogenase [Rhodoferax sp.]|jgi:3-oxoacyl-[acyl-carrier protein] reductase|nr:glucose 1-dehydrogenase [Rhodoferax sp.]
MQVELDGRVALVTGAAQGIGQAIAHTLVRNGARVVYTDVHGAAAQASADAGGGVAAFALDVASPTDVASGVERVLRAQGRIDILVNNAGIGVPAAERKTIDAFSLEHWDALLRIDLTGLFLMSREVSRAMKAQRTGRIINIASVLGLVPARLQSSYIAAKAGVVNLTKAMALELAPHGVLVNAVAPGSTQTEGWQKWIRDAGSEAQDLHARLMTHIPLGRPGTTQEMADAVLFLAAPESSYITGHVLTVDGGWTAGFSRDF